MKEEKGEDSLPLQEDGGGKEEKQEEIPGKGNNDEKEKGYDSVMPFSVLCGFYERCSETSKTTAKKMVRVFPPFLSFLSDSFFSC